MIDQYRKMADKARSDADAAALPNVRLLHLRSAARFDEIVAGMEMVLQAKLRNENARQSGG
jgi:hypothetical protein